MAKIHWYIKLLWHLCNFVDFLKIIFYNEFNLLGRYYMENNNLGSVYFDKNKNRWICSYYIHDDIANEKKRARKLFKSEIEAKEFLDRYNLNDGKIVEQPEYTLKEMLDKILYHSYLVQMLMFL